MTDQKLKGARENRVNRRTQKLYLIFCKNDATFIRGIRYSNLASSLQPNPLIFFHKSPAYVGFISASEQ